MYAKIGSLRDLQLAKEVIRKLEKEGFSGRTAVDDKDGDLYWIEVEPGEKSPQAQIILAQYLGLLPKYALEKREARVDTGKMGPVTKVLLYGSILVFFVQLYFQYKFGLMIFEKYFLFGLPDESKLFSSLEAMQLWRFFTPAFLHFGLMHILFNSLAMKDFGSALEYAEGSRFVFWLALFSALFSNTFQYMLTGPMFGGMSGVVYAFFGHFMGRQMMKRPSIVKIPRQGVIWLIIWFFATFLPGPIQHMANGAHLGGLLFGMLSGLGKFSSEGVRAWILSLLAILSGFVILLLIEIYRLPEQLYFKQKGW